MICKRMMTAAPACTTVICTTVICPTVAWTALAWTTVACAADPVDVWPGLAPGESTRSLGTAQPRRPNEVPPVTRIEKITRPTFTVHVPAKPNGTGIVILPGGGFGKVVPDKEGTEAAEWLNGHGVAAFVVSYRTTAADQKDPPWLRPLQDAQRALKLIRQRGSKWGVKSNRVGLLGFSAGGQVAARLLTDKGKTAYSPVDAVDETPHRPDFALLIYPWNIYDAKRDALLEPIAVTKACPPTYLAHTDDDRSSSLGAVLFYAELKRRGIPAELHVYGNGGHGYGIRPVKGSQISTWTQHAAHWIGTRGFLATGK